MRNYFKNQMTSKIVIRNLNKLNKSILTRLNKFNKRVAYKNQNQIKSIKVKEIVI